VNIAGKGVQQKKKRGGGDEERGTKVKKKSGNEQQGMQYAMERNRVEGRYE